MLNTILTSHKERVDLAALLLRLGFGFFMAFSHGLPKLNKLLAGGDIQFASIFGLSPTLSLILAVFAEFFCALLVIIGLKTRWASLPIIVTMFIAGFWVHLQDPLFHNQQGGSKEFALIYLFGFLGIFVLGSGQYSVDHALRKKTI